MNSETGEAELPAVVAPPRRRRWMWWSSAGTVALVVAVGLVIGLSYWVAHPGGLAIYTGGTTQAGVGQIGEVFVFDSGIYPASGGAEAVVTVTVDRAVARIVENSADADVEVLRCQIRDPHLHVGVMRDADLADVCSTVGSPFDGATSLGPDQQLVLRITPRRAGTIRIEGVDLAYHRGVQRGTFHVGSVSVLTTS